MNERWERKDESEKKNRKDSEKLLKNYLKQHAIRRKLGQAEPELGTVKRVRASDLFELPPKPTGQELFDKHSDPWENHLCYQRFIKENYDNLEDVDFESEEFLKFPKELQLEILLEMKELRFVNHWADIDNLPEKSSDFAKFQMEKIIRQNKLTARLDALRKEINALSSGLSADDIAGLSAKSFETQKFASEDSRHYILIKGHQRLLASINERQRGDLRSTLLGNVEDYLSGVATSRDAECHSMSGGSEEVQTTQKAVEENDADDRVRADGPELGKLGIGDAERQIGRAECRNKEDYIDKNNISDVGSGVGCDRSGSNGSGKTPDTVSRFQHKLERSSFIDKINDKKFDLPAILAKRWAERDKYGDKILSVSSLDGDCDGNTDGEPVGSGMEGIAGLDRELSMSDGANKNCTLEWEMMNFSGGGSEDRYIQINDTMDFDDVSYCEEGGGVGGEQLFRSIEDSGRRRESQNLNDGDDVSSEDLVTKSEDLPVSKTDVEGEGEMSSIFDRNSYGCIADIESSSGLSRDHEDNRGVLVNVDSAIVQEDGFSSLSTLKHSPPKMTTILQPVKIDSESDEETEEKAVAGMSTNREMPSGATNTMSNLSSARLSDGRKFVFSDSDDEKDKREFESIAIDNNDDRSIAKVKNTTSSCVEGVTSQHEADDVQFIDDSDTSSEDDVSKCEVLTGQCSERAHYEGVEFVNVGRSETRVENVQGYETEGGIRGADDVTNSTKLQAFYTPGSVASRGASEKGSEFGDDVDHTDLTIAREHEVERDEHEVERDEHVEVEFRGLNEMDLKNLEQDLQTETVSLQSEISNRQRMAATISDQMYIEAQELLRLFGVPYVLSPMEAEAQCAFLDQSNLTHGTVTDDSDVWLFGGQRVYKNFFFTEKTVDFYDLKAIHQKFGLDNDKLIHIGMVCGSDYTPGLFNVGPVTAMEILAEFAPHGQQALHAFRQWWDHAQTQLVAPVESRVKARLRKLKLPKDFPSDAVYDAYKHPQVDSSLEASTWKSPDFSALKVYAEKKLRWSANKVSEILAPVMKRFNENKSQRQITSFFDTMPPDVERDRQQIRSQRIRHALSKNQTEGYTDSDEMAAKKKEAAKIFNSKKNKKQTSAAPKTKIPEAKTRKRKTKARVVNKQSLSKVAESKQNKRGPNLSESSSDDNELTEDILKLMDKDFEDM